MLETKLGRENSLELILIRYSYSIVFSRSCNAPRQVRSETQIIAAAAPTGIFVVFVQLPPTAPAQLVTGCGEIKSSEHNWQSKWQQVWGWIGGDAQQKVWAPGVISAFEGVSESRKWRVVPCVIYAIWLTCWNRCSVQGKSDKQRKWFQNIGKEYPENVTYIVDWIQVRGAVRT